MLNVYFNGDDKAKLRMFRTAQYKDDAGNKINFRYCLIEREDINKIEILKNIEMEESTITIRTTSGLPFSTQRKIVIDGKQYTINSIYKENQKEANGMFRKNVQPFVYLILKH